MTAVAGYWITVYEMTRSISLEKVPQQYSPCCWPCRSQTGASGWFPTGPDTSPTPPGSPGPLCWRSHL